MSGYSDDELFEQIKGYGVDGFIKKPITLSSLTAKLDEVLGGGEMRETDNEV